MFPFRIRTNLIRIVENRWFSSACDQSRPITVLLRVEVIMSLILKRKTNKKKMFFSTFSDNSLLRSPTKSYLVILH